MLRIMWQHCIRKKYQKLIVLHTSLARFTKSKISKNSPLLERLYGEEEGVGRGGGWSESTQSLGAALLEELLV